VYEVKYQYRDPMKHAEELVSDPTLSKHSHFHAEEKFVHRDHRVDQVRDEPWTGKEWYDFEVYKCCS
jgi:hypothetical protein